MYKAGCEVKNVKIDFFENSIEKNDGYEVS